MYSVNHKIVIKCKVNLQNLYDMFMTPILQTIEKLRNRTKVELVHTEDNNNNVYFRIYTCKLSYNRQTSVRLT